MRLSVFLVAALALSGCVCASWDAASFPDPQQDPAACGRDVTGWVCSPDGLASQADLSVVEGHIRAVHDGKEPYKHLYCSRSDSEVPAEIFVALVKRVSGSGSAQKRIEAFAKGLHDRFGVGSCGSGVVLVVAVEDRQAYISVGDVARKQLSPARIQTVLADMKPLLRSHRYGRALERAIVQIGLVLAGSNDASGGGSDGDKGSWKDYSPLAIFAAVVGFVQLRGFRARRRRRTVTGHLRRLQNDFKAAKKGKYVASSCPICFNDFAKPVSEASPVTAPSAPPDEDGASTSAPSATEAFKASEAAASESEALLGDRAATAPPADESSSRNTKENGGKGVLPFLLPCGHAFCEPCIGKWLKSNPCCPVCRKSAHPGDEGRPQPPLPPADPRQPDDSDTRRRRNGSGDVDNRGNRDPCAGALRYRDLTNLELAFRMAQLRRRYPGFISEGLANEFVATGGEVDWQNHADFAAQTSEAARGGFEQRGATNTFSSFGGGHSSGGGGSSW